MGAKTQEIIANLIGLLHWPIEILVVYLIWNYYLSTMLSEYSFWVKALSIFITWVCVASMSGIVCGRILGRISAERWKRMRSKP